jgi:drug/metabolite transporter (DMT)-like permease
VYSLLLSYFFLKERPSVRQLAGTAMIICGVSLILFKEHMSVRWRGDIIILLSVSMFQISHIAAKKLPQNYSPALIACARALYSLLWGLPIMAAAVLFFHFHLVLKPVLRTFCVIFFIGALTYGIRNLLWYKAIRNMELAKATAVLLCYPVFTYIISLLFGLDSARAYQIIGLVLAVSGAYTVTKIIRLNSPAAPTKITSKIV